MPLPKIRFSELPQALWQHLLGRVRQREISLDDLRQLQRWAKSEPQAPDGEWYKDFGSFKLCGAGPYPKTVLTRNMKAYGAEIK
jgi:hypothetical protein